MKNLIQVIDEKIRWKTKLYIYIHINISHPGMSGGKSSIKLKASDIYSDDSGSDSEEKQSEKRSTSSSRSSSDSEEDGTTKTIAGT